VAWHDFTGLDEVSAAVQPLFAGSAFARWWFETGAVLGTEQRSTPSDFTLEATSFSGDVRLSWRDTFPAGSGAVIEQLSLRSDAFDACAVAEYARGPEDRQGHGVITFDLDASGGMSNLVVQRPLDASDPSVASPFAACLKSAVDGLRVASGAKTHVTWPVVFGPPPEEEEAEGTSAGGMVRPNSMSPHLDVMATDPQPRK